VSASLAGVGLVVAFSVCLEMRFAASGFAGVVDEFFGSEVAVCPTFSSSGAGVAGTTGLSVRVGVGAAITLPGDLRAR
jgi:hypothetical protein